MRDIDKMKCKENATLEDVLDCIDKNAKKVAFIVDDNSKMIGLLTEGDVRRLLLNGHGLKEKAINYAKKDFKYASVNNTAEEIAGMFNHIVSIIPVLDDEGCVVDFSEYYEDMHISVAQPQLSGNEYKYLMDAFLSTWISSTGKYIGQFERDFSKWCGSQYGVATSNGTTALHLALVALGVGIGDEVIVPDITFAATINAVIYTGATPVIVDVEENSWCIDPDRIEEAITEKTKAIIPVHLYGQPCDMGKICKIAKDNNLFIIEDCAEAHGAKWDGQKVGSFGDVGCFSFFGNKVITTGEGGMCITDNTELDKKMRVLRDHGMSKTKKYYHEVIGFNYRMTNMQAAIGCGQLERIDKILAFREELENQYRCILKDSNISFQKNDIAKRDKITWLVSGLIEEEKREKVSVKMKENGIDIRNFFIPLSEMDIYRKYAKECYVSHSISRRGINFPTSYEVNETVIKKIADIIQETC